MVSISVPTSGWSLGCDTAAQCRGFFKRHFRPYLQDLDEVAVAEYMLPVAYRIWKPFNLTFNSCQNKRHVKSESIREERGVLGQDDVEYILA